MAKIIGSLVLLFDPSGHQVFMARKTKKIGVGKYTGPGGKLENNETPKQTAVRETWEEVGVRLQMEDLNQVAEILFKNGSDQEFLVHIFTASKYSGVPQDGDEMTEGKWFGVSDLIANPRQVEMMAGDYTFLPLILSGQKIVGWCEYESNSNQGIVLGSHYETVKTFTV